MPHILVRQPVPGSTAVMADLGFESKQLYPEPAFELQKCELLVTLNARGWGGIVTV